MHPAATLKSPATTYLPSYGSALRPEWPAVTRRQNVHMRIAIWDVPDEWRQVHELPLEPLVEAAAVRADEEGYVAATDYDWNRKGDVEALISAKNGPDGLTPPDTPVAVVEFLPDATDAPPVPDIRVMPDYIGYSLLRLSPHFRDAAVSTLARWLRSNVGVDLTTRERAQLEVVVGEIQRLLDSGRFDREDIDEVAMAQAAVDTIQAQLKAPRPSRNIIRWGLSQIPGFMIGALAGVAGNYLTSLLGGF